MNLAKIPKLKLGHLNTPIEFLPRLSSFLGTTEIWIKRDDCTGLSTGGNKTRKLEFLMAEAKNNKADIILTHGATQSNHVRQTAAACAKLGLKCHVLLENRTNKNEINYRFNGNVLLNSLHGATMETRSAGEDMDVELEKIANRLKKEGNRPYVIPGGGSNATGAMGYVNCSREIVSQSFEMSIPFDLIITATGSAGTQAGLIVGLRAQNIKTPLIGISVKALKDEQESKVFKLSKLTAEKLECSQAIRRQDIVANCDYIGPGYGFPDKRAIDAIGLFANLEGILLDPVYTGKAAAGLIDLLKTGAFKEYKRILFIHTGGSVVLSSYLESFNYQS